MTDGADRAAWAEPGAASVRPACSDWSRAQRLRPIGSAGHYRGFLLVEQPLPWPSDVATIAELVGLARVAADAGMRLQVVIAAGPADGNESSTPGEGLPAQRTLTCYRPAGPAEKGTPGQDGGWAGPLLRSERVAPVGSLADVAADLVWATGGDDRRPAGTVREEPAQVVDVLVCTHGRRDICCGAKGMDLVKALLDEPVAKAGTPIRLWRTSHTGGHRFAPTAVVLPSATLWAWADRPLLQQVVTGEGPVEDVLGRYRGFACLASPPYQAFECAVLAEVGWPLLRSRRRALDLGGGRARLETEHSGAWEATVREGRWVPQPDCRTDPASAVKFSVEWVVEDLRSVALV